MTVIHAPKTGGTAAIAQPIALRPDIEDHSTEVLFPEAKRRERHRRLTIVATLVAVVGLAGGLIASFGGAPPRRADNGAVSGDAGSPANIAGHVVLRGDGIGTAHFGQTESVAIVAIGKVLGSPKTAKPTSSPGNCTIDAYLAWPTMTAYFFHGRFVGYDTSSILGGSQTRKLPNAVTGAGMRIGDTLAQAQRIYGSALTTSGAQGGSWFAKTSTGTLAGYLTSEPNWPSPPAPRIADVTAGSVGCPAASL